MPERNLSAHLRAKQLSQPEIPGHAEKDLRSGGFGLDSFHGPWSFVSCLNHQAVQRSWTPLSLFELVATRNGIGGAEGRSSGQASYSWRPRREDDRNILLPIPLSALLPNCRRIEISF